jgi:predicted transcriptional regulator
MSKKKEKEICGICCEKINVSNKKDIKCLYCNYVACRECIAQFLLININEPNCMNCKNVWNREFLCNNFTKTFINNDYRDYRQKLLLDKEKALLPATQIIVEAMNNKKKLQNTLSEYLIEFNTKKQQLNDEIDLNESIINGKTINVQKKVFIRKCGVEDCRGFLSEQWKCGLCDTTTCKKCLEILNNNQDQDQDQDQENIHVCKEENIESAKLISKDSKPCPKCAALIFKIDGCNQMWCVLCHTAFSWVTGQIETSRIHNPHYYEMLRNMSANGEIPREPENICNDGDIGMPNNNQIEILLLTKRNKSEYNIFKEKILNISRKIFHILYHHPNNFQQKYDKEKRNLRISYIMNYITEEHWKKELQRKEKKYEKALNLYQVSKTLDNIGGDIIRSIQTKNINTIYDDFEKLRNNINDGLYQIGKQFSDSYYTINKEWDYLSLKIGTSIE